MCVGLTEDMEAYMGNELDDDIIQDLKVHDVVILIGSVCNDMLPISVFYNT